MPPVIIGAALSTAFTAAAAYAVGTAITVGLLATTFATSLIIGGLSYALAGKPKSGAAPDTSTGSTVAVRQPDLTRQHVYGHTRITRGYAHMSSTGLNGKLHIILMLCEGPLRAINEVILNDYSIPNDWIDDDGNVTQGRYKGKLIIRKHLGTETQAADTLAISNLSNWTVNHKLSGIAYLYMVMTKDQDVYPTGVPNVSCVVEGPTVYDPRSDSEVWTSNIALFSHDFLRNSKYGFAVTTDDVDLLNVAAQANICDEIVDTNQLDSIVASINTSTNIITMDTTSLTVLQYQFGDRVEVISTGTLPGGITADTDYYVIPYQINGTPRMLLATSLEDSLNKVAIDITSAGSGSITIRKTGEPRYHGGGIVDTETNLSDTLNNLVTSMAGRAINIGGFWTLLAGAWRTPEMTLTISDMRAAMNFKSCLSMAESFNTVKGLFVSSVNSYQESDYPAARYQTFIDQDNGLESPKDLNLPYCNRPTTAQRIAKIELFRARQDIVFNCDFSTKALKVQPGDNIMLTVDKLGWNEKYFEITEFSFDSNNGALVTRLTLRETAQAIFDWTAGEAIDYDPAPNTELPSPFDVVVPTGVYYNSREIGTQEGDVVFVLTLGWDPHPDAFVRQFGDFEVQYKLSAETDWRPSFFVAGDLVSTDVLNSSVNVSYDLRVRARNNLGVRSQWDTILGAVVGSSGGVTTTYDWLSVASPVTEYLDWGNVYDIPGTLDDWGFVN